MGKIIIASKIVGPAILDVIWKELEILSQDLVIDKVMIRMKLEQAKDADEFTKIFHEHLGAYLTLIL